MIFLLDTCLLPAKMMGMQTHSFKVGDRVLFGRTHGEHTLGTVVKINAGSLKVRQDEERGHMRTRAAGTLWRVPPSLCRHADAAGVSAPVYAPVPASATKREDHVVLREIDRIYGDLSPENLTCDGELSNSQVARKASSLRARLKACFKELGRVVTEEECVQRWMAQDAARRSA